MDIFLYSFNAVIPMFFPVVLGWIIRRLGQINEDNINFLNRIVFRYLLPLHLFNSIVSIDFRTEFSFALILFFVICLFSVIVLAWIVFALTVKDREKRCILIVSAFRSNNLIYALPLAAGLFGIEGVKAAAMLVPFTIIMFNFFCVIVMVCHAGGGETGGTDLFKTTKRAALDVMRNPLIMASVLGVLFSALAVPFAGFVKSGLAMLAAPATPVALLLLGAQLDFRQLAGNIVPALGACALRLVLVPAVLVPLAVYAGFRGPRLGALMVAFAAPSAVNNLIMARNYRIAPVFAAQTVCLSTVLSLLTIFGFVTLLRSLGLF